MGKKSNRPNNWPGTGGSPELDACFNFDERARIVRRTIVRYICVTFTFTLTLMSPKAKKRFPTLNHFVDAGLFTKEEKKIFEDLDNEYPNYTKNWQALDVP
ncbi:hypothetical protein HUJ05_002040 [Dendroctonus ponderosae]|nr:hypothetical protein HUJ05_002040 [Dendroctonus ponderosae]